MYKQKHKFCEQSPDWGYNPSSGPIKDKNPYPKRASVSGFWYGLIIGLTLTTILVNL